MIKNILLAIIAMLLLQNCTTLNQMAIQWRYRNDYKLPIPIKPQVSEQSMVASTHITIENKKKLLPNIANTPTVSSLSNTPSINSERRWIMAKLENKTKKIRIPVLQSIAIDTPPPNKYYNNYYSSTNEKRIQRHAKRGYMFGFLSFIPYGGLVLSFFAIINGAIGLYKINQEPELYRGRGFAIAGIGMGVLVLSLYALLIFLILMSIDSNGTGFI